MRDNSSMWFYEYRRRLALKCLALAGLFLVVCIAAAVTYHTWWPSGWMVVLSVVSFVFAIVSVLYVVVIKH